VVNSTKTKVLLLKSKKCASVSTPYNMGQYSRLAVKNMHFYESITDNHELFTHTDYF